MPTLAPIREFLRSRGWRRYLGGPLWFKQLPGWPEGRPAFNQELHCLMTAFSKERLHLLVDGELYPCPPKAVVKKEPAPPPGPEAA